MPAGADTAHTVAVVVTLGNSDEDPPGQWVKGPTNPLGVQGRL